MTFILEFFPKTPDVHVHRPRFDLHGIGISPNHFQYLLPIQHPAVGLDQRTEQIEFLDREVDQTACNPDLVFRFVDFQRPDPPDPACLRIAPPPQNCLDPRHQLPWGKWLDKVIVRAHFQAYHAIDFFRFGRQHDNGYIGERRITTKQPANFQPIDPGQHEIQHDQVRAFGPGELQRSFSLGRLDTGQSFLFKVVANKINDRLFIIHD